MPLANLPSSLCGRCRQVQMGTRVLAFASQKREFARSTPDKRACRSPSGECEPYVSLRSTQSFVRRLKPSFCRKPCLLQNHKTSVRLLTQTPCRLTSGARQKQKTTPIGVERECVREFRLWRIFLLAAHVSELPSPCSQNANPCICFANAVID